MNIKKISYLLIITLTLSFFLEPPYNSVLNTIAQAADCSNSNNQPGVWESVYFGRYWQSDTNGDNIADTKDNKEPIRWRVLNRSGDYALLLSDKILDAGKFYAGGDAATWETSDIRNWLNTTFYQAAFNDAEKEAISVQTLSNEGNENVFGLTTNSTKDKVFLLSYSDVCSSAYGFDKLTYRDDTNTRTAAITDYVATKPGMYMETGSSDAWWLRNSGITEETAYHVSVYGGIDPFNIPVNIISGIRPAIYVNLYDKSLWSDGGQVTATDLPEGKNINKTMRDEGGNLPIAATLPDWAGNSPVQGDKHPDPGADIPQKPIVNMAHLSFTKQSKAGKSSANISGNDYISNSYYATQVFSHIEQMPDGTYQRVEACDDGVYVEQYSELFELINSKKIEMPLPLFGGYFNGINYNFLVFGQENPDEDNNIEVVRVVKYDKNWNEIGSCRISGINTTIPFWAGSLRMTETDGMLYIHTCHRMYMSEDGKNHQANMSFVINQLSMELTQKQYIVYNISSGYVSHSFNQFIATDGSYIYRLDHGDAYPRSVVLTKCNNNNIVSSINTMILPIAGGTGDNNTGVSVGGFEINGNTLLTVGNSIEQSDENYFDPGRQRNIFVAVTDTMLNNTSFKWLTDYTEKDSVKLGNPHMVSSGDGYYVMWEEQKNGESVPLTKIVKIDLNGNKTEGTYTLYARLSDCKPILTSKKQLLWYTTSGDAPVFYLLDTAKLADYEYSGKGDIHDCVITLDKDTYEYQGTAGEYRPVPAVKYGDYTLKEGQDYTVSYSGNNNPGTAKVIVKGNGFFEGEKVIEFKIISSSLQREPGNNQSSASVPSNSNANNKKPTWNTISSLYHTTGSFGTDTDADKNNTKNNPAKVKGVKLKIKSKQTIKVTWKKAKNAYYYKVQLAKNTKFTKSKKSVTSYGRKITFYGLSRKTTYYVRVRAVGQSNGKWSSIKKIRM